MDRSQQYIAALLNKVPKWELADPQDQSTFERIKGSLTSAADLRAQLQSLYKVSSFSDVALGLLWITEKVERDPSKVESTLDEESFILGLLKNAFGGSPSEGGQIDAGSFGQPFGFDFPQPASADGALPDESTPAPVSDFGLTESPVAESAGSFPASTDETAGGNEQNFSMTLEKLLEAVQSGSEERTVLVEQLSHQAEEIVSAQDTDGDYKAFCGYLLEFLKYVSENQLFDDIRMMNLISNVYDPFSRWATADAVSRAGMLEQPIEMLRDFKALFE
jgi:hypothetical protein